MAGDPHGPSGTPFRQPGFFPLPWRSLRGPLEASLLLMDTHNLSPSLFGHLVRRPFLLSLPGIHPPPE